MDYQLVVVRGRSANRVLLLGNGVTTVGRQEDCQLRIASSKVSRRHCQLYEREGKLLIMDLGSSNGTFVNGQKIEGQQVLKPGDVLTLGTVKLRVEHRAAAGAKAAAPGRKPSDTAVAEPEPVADEGSSEEFEIEFDENDDDAEEIEIEEEEPAAPAAAAPAAAAQESKTETTMPASQKAAGQKPAAPEKAKASGETETMGEEAVADFLLNIDLDDDDKR